MLETMRKHHYVLMLIIAVVVIISFSFWGGYDSTRNAGSWSKKIYEEVYREPDVKAAETAFRVAQQAGSFSDALGKYSQLLMTAQGTVRGNREEDFFVEALVTSVTVRKEAELLGIAVEEEDLKKAVQKLQRFQTDGKFDREKYETFIANSADRNAQERALFSALRDSLLLEKLQKVFGGTVPASEFQVNLTYNDQHGKTTAKVIVLPRKEHEALKPTDEDVQKYYDANKGKKVEELDPAMTSDEAVDVQYAKIDLAKREDISKLPQDQQDAKKKEWDEHDKKVRVTASQLSNVTADEGKSLEEAAKSLKDNPAYLPVEVKTAAALTEKNKPEDLKAEEQAVDQMLVENNGTVKGTNGYIIYHVSKKSEAAMLPLDQAKPKIVEKLTKEKIDAALQDKANAVRSKLQEALTANKPFAEALTAAGVTTEELVLSGTKPPTNPPAYYQAVRTEAANLNAGSLAANAIPSGDDLVLVYVDKKELPWDKDKGPLDKASLAKRLGLGSNPYQPSPLFMTWFMKRREEASPTFTSAN